MSGVKVSTTHDGYFARLEHERVLLEFSKDGDSPNCPRSWTWHMWFDGDYIDGTSDEASLVATVKDAIVSIGDIIGELAEVREYLSSYEVFGMEPEAIE